MLPKTEHALIDACYSVSTYCSGESSDSWEVVAAKVQLALRLVERDRGEPAKKHRRRLTPKAILARGQLRRQEWSTSAELAAATGTHRFADAIYNLRQNAYEIIKQYRQGQWQHKMVRGPGWLGWSQGQPILPAGNRAQHRRPPSPTRVRKVT